MKRCTNSAPMSSPRLHVVSSTSYLHLLTSRPATREIPSVVISVEACWGANSGDKNRLHRHLQSEVEVVEILGAVLPRNILAECLKLKADPSPDTPSYPS
jgi:hypothetical protein